MRGGKALVLAACLGACANAGGSELASRGPQATALDPEVRDNPLLAAAALLAAAEAAGGDAERRPYVAQLDALSVVPQDGIADDPLTQWRLAYASDGVTPWRGRALGPAYRRARMAPGETVTIEQIFLAGQRAEMAAQSEGGQPVLLAVADPRTEMVCEAELTPRGSCRWLPVYTERYSITLTNRSEDRASIYLVFR